MVFKLPPISIDAVWNTLRFGTHPHLMQFVFCSVGELLRTRLIVGAGHGTAFVAGLFYRLRAEISKYEVRVQIHALTLLLHRRYCEEQEKQNNKVFAVYTKVDAGPLILLMKA
eukprot:6204529-Pleurochrysis_carterae.AAC.1